MRRRAIEGLGTWQLLAIVLSTWSDRRSFSTAHPPLVAQVMLTMVRAVVLSPPVARLTCVASPLLRMLEFLEISQSSTVSPRWSVDWRSSQGDEVGV